MPDYTTVSTPALVFLLRKWQESNTRKPTRAKMEKIKAIKAALSKPQTRSL